MPYSDNLYPDADESDGDGRESFSHELSPADGFLSPNRMPSDVMVQDPSLPVCEEEDKVLILNDEARMQSNRGASSSANPPSLGRMFPSQNNASARSNPIHSPRSNPSPIAYNPPSPVAYRRTDNIFPGDNAQVQGPPPAYTPTSPTSPTSPASPNTPHTRLGYNTFEPRSLEEAVVPPREPQSMGAPVEAPNEFTPLSFHPDKSLRRRRILKRFLLFALISVVIVTILGMRVEWTWENDPLDLPGSPKLPAGSADSYCPSATYKKDEMGRNFSLGREISVIQTTHGGRSETYGVTTTGEIRFRKLPQKYSKSYQGHISLDIRVSDPELEVVVSWDDNSQSLHVSTPTSATERKKADRHCIAIEITVWLPSNADLSCIEVQSTSLTLRVMDDIQTKVSGKSILSTVAGDVYFLDGTDKHIAAGSHFPFDSRDITVETISGNIKGIFPLYDSLRLSSQSGEVTAGVFPQQALASAPASASLDVSTASGDIEIELPVQVPKYTPPPRDYVTRVISASGGLSGDYYLGSLGSFKSTSGDIDITVLPVIQSSPTTNPDDAPESTFETLTVSSQQVVNVLDPVFIAHIAIAIPDTQPPPNPYEQFEDDERIPLTPLPPLKVDLQSAQLEQESSFAVMKQWRTLNSSHRTSSGDISVDYPQSWEGTLTATTISADITAKGDDLRIIESKKGWAYKKVVVGKGASKVGDGSESSMGSISGNLYFLVGKN